LLKNWVFVLVQRENEPVVSPKKRNSALRAGIFKAWGSKRSDGITGRLNCSARVLIIVSMSPSGYPSAWLRPRSGIPDRWSGQSGKEQADTGASGTLE
jgi:hypothetical protein